MRYLRFSRVNAVITLISILINSPSSAQQATSVIVDSVKTEPVKQTVLIIGRIVATETGVISSRIAGPVGMINVEVGDRVQKDDIIAHLIDDSLNWSYKLTLAESSQAEAKVGKSKAIFDLRSQEFRRLQSLEESAAFSKARLEDKNLEVTSAKKTLAEAKANLVRSRANQKLAEINLYNAKIRAPFEGVISKLHTYVGEFVKVGSSVAEIINDKQLEIEANVPTKRINALLPGSKISFWLDTEKTVKNTKLSAVVRAILPIEDPLTRTRSVRFSIETSVSKYNFAQNQSIILAIPAGEEREVLTIHKDAVINRKGENIAFIVENGKAQIRSIKLGEAVGSRFIVIAGLKNGDIIVTRGNERLRNGEKVRH